MYGTNFYSATGLHGLHVGFALFSLGVVNYWMFGDKTYKELHSTLKLCAYYWHLVDNVWFDLLL
jgi:cytochrome c oxidase subunit 3